MTPNTILPLIHAEGNNLIFKNQGSGGMGWERYREERATRSPAKPAGISPEILDYQLRMASHGLLKTRTPVCGENQSL
jgi:hypothetical protein